MHEQPAQPEHPANGPKPVKLRESCDSCLVAKVKCSKGRPLCSRCLQNGAECGYSPSSRAGRKNRDGGPSKASAHRSKASLSAGSQSSSSQRPASMYQLSASNTANSEDSRSRTKNEGNGNIDSSTTLVAPDDQGPASEKQIPMATDGNNISADDFLPTPPFNDFFDSFLPLSPEAVFAELASAAPSPGIQNSAIPAWSQTGDGYPMLPPFHGPLDFLSFGQASSPQSLARPGPPPPQMEEQHHNENTINGRPTCDCFAACLQALLLLHNHSWTTASTQQGGPPFDIVLNINREAIEGCSTMLSCGKCITRIGNGISTMLLSTIFGKVMSLYRAACYFRFGATPGMQATAQLAFGAYTVTGEDRQLLEIEILLIELRKVENILKIFQEKFDSPQAERDETSVYNALTTYLDKNLSYIVAFLQARKGSLCK
ncbi:MAG: hypothetical protein Q9213_004385 [Squamulea squamosa]